MAKGVGWSWGTGVKSGFCLVFLFCLGFVYENLLFDFHKGDTSIKEKIRVLNICVFKLFISYFTKSFLSPILNSALHPLQCFYEHCQN